MHWLIGIQTQVLAWTLQWPANQLQALSAAVWKPLESTILDSHPQTRAPLWKSGFPVENFQHIFGAINEFRCFEEEQFDFILIILPSRWHSSGPRETFSACDFSWRGKCKWLSTQLLQLCGKPPKRPISLLPHPDYWILSCMMRGWEGARRIADRTLGGH